MSEDNKLNTAPEDAAKSKKPGEAELTEQELSTATGGTGEIVITKSMDSSSPK
jgi:hypothetical protein